MAHVVFWIAGLLGLPTLVSGIADGRMPVIVVGGVLVGCALVAGTRLAVRRPPTPGKGRLFGIGG